MSVPARFLFILARRYVESGWLGIKVERVGSQQPGEEDALVWILNRLNEPTPPALEELVASPPGMVGWSMATYEEPFELRKVQFIWSSQDAAAPTDDARVITFHLAKLSGGAVVDTWDSADFTAADAAFATWWGSIKDRFPDTTVWDRIKFYKDGPDITPPQVPVYDADKAIPGTNTSAPLPPQVAISVTEKAGSKRFWGRFYLPHPCYDTMGAYGRLSSTTQGDIADATDVLFTSLNSANLQPVVYRAALPVRQTAAERRLGVTPGSLPARAATAWSITDIQVDDVFDVIRSRRWKYPLLRVQRAI